MNFKGRGTASLKFICSFFLFTLVVILIPPLPVFANWTEPRFNKLHNSSVPFKVHTDLETKWSSQNLTTINSSPAVDNEGNIYLSTNSGLTALDKNGVKKWNFNALVNGGPVLDSFNNIYFSGGNCGSFIFSLDKNGTKRWQYDLRGSGGLCGYNSASPITLSNNETALYVGSSYPRSTILAFNLDGTLKWEAGLNGQSPSGAPTVAPDGTIYTGTGGNSRLFALNENGAIKWNRFIASGPTVHVSSPVLDPDGNIYVYGQGSTPATFASLNSQGNQRWKYSLPSDISFNATPAIKDNRVYQVEGNSLRALDKNTGTTIWVWSTPATRALNQPVVDADNNIYTSVLNQLFIIGQDGQTKKTITLENYLSLFIIPEDDLIYISRNIGINGYLYALGKKKLTKIPLIFIPGIGGSELKVKNNTSWSEDDGHGGIYTRSYKALEKVWVNEDEARALGNDDYFDILRLKPDGETSEAELELDGIYEGSYESTIRFFEASGYILNKDLFVFPYDWRKDLALTKNLLDQKIESIKQQTGASKVDLVAHSMGGLVARNYIADTEKASKVQKMITLGTPNLGSTKLLKALHYGDCLTKEGVPTQPICIGLSKAEVSDILQNMPGPFQLAPSQKYFDFYTGSNLYPSPFKDLRDIDSNGVIGELNYNQIKDLLTNLGHNTSLFSKAETFHSIDNNLANTNGVETTLIVGSGIATLGQIIEKYKFNFAGIKIPQKDEIKINGDDTVPLFSASLDDPSRNLSLKGSARVYYTKQSHGNLVTDGPALELVKNILKNDSGIPGKISTTPYLVNGKQLSVYSPVNLHAYDSLGNHTGVLDNGDFEAQIPGSYYDNLDDAKFIFLPEDGVYQIKFEATDKGSFDFKIKDYKDNENTSTILYKNIPLTSSTTGEAQLDTNSETLPTLLIDQNEISPTSVLLGDAVLDTTPPKSEIILNGIKGSNSFYKSDVSLEIKATDDISGVLKIEYSLDNGLTVNSYLSPISFSKEGTHKLKYRAVDKAGNEEAPREIEIKIDKTAPEAKIQYSLEGKNIEITGLDNLASVTAFDNGEGLVILTDEAGNQTSLMINPKDKKRKDRLEIKSISYNEDSLIEPSKNLFIINSHFDKNSKLKNLVQSILIKNQEIVAAIYNSQKDKTIITNRQLKDKPKLLEKDGVVLLNLVTNKGILEAGY